jgi:hypothetical protein
MKWLTVIGYVVAVVLPAMCGEVDNIERRRLDRNLPILLQLESRTPVCKLGVTDEIAGQAKLLVEGYMWLILNTNAYDVNIAGSRAAKRNDEGREEATREDGVAIRLLCTLTDRVLVSWTNRLPSAIREANSETLGRGREVVSVLSVLATDPWDDGTGLRNRGRDRSLTEIARDYEKEILVAGKKKWLFEFDCEDAFKDVVIASNAEIGSALWRANRVAWGRALCELCNANCSPKG